MIEGKVKGYFLWGQNPAVGLGGPPGCSGWRWRKLDWLVVRDLAMIESATFWQDSPEVATGELTTEQIGDRGVLPAGGLPRGEGPAASPIPSGCCSGTTRQWNRPARLASDLSLDPTGQANPRRGSPRLPDPPAIALLQSLTWDYGESGELAEPDAEAVLREVNGRGPDGSLLSGFAQLSGRVDRVCGNWISPAVRPRGEPDRERKPQSEQTWVAPEWGWAWPAKPAHPVQPRVRRPAGKAVERGEGLHLVERGQGRVDRARRAGHREEQVTRLRSARRRGRPGRAGRQSTRSSCNGTARARCSSRAG